MKYETKFDVGESVFCIMDNKITECIVTKITFPDVSLLLSNIYNNMITYYVHKKLDNMPESRSYIICKSNSMHEHEIGKTVDELLEKIGNFYKKDTRNESNNNHFICNNGLDARVMR